MYFVMKNKRTRYERCATEEESDDDSEKENFIKTYKDTIYFRGEIKEPQATEFCIEIRKMAERQFDTSQGVITLRLSSDGGDVFAGLRMYEAMKRCKVPTTVICEGCVASAATLVMLGASQRYMYDTSVILVHSLKSWMAGYAKPKEIKEELQNSETLTDICTDLYKKHCKITKSALNKMYDTDLYMRADQCLKLGFVQSVI